MFQKPPTETSDPFSVELSPWEKLIRADQKLVSLIDFPLGRSIMKRPSSETSQKPAFLALDVQIYVFYALHV